MTHRPSASNVPETPVYVSLVYASRQTGLDPAEIEALTEHLEPSGIYADGPMEPVIRSARGPSGLMVHLPDAMEIAPGIKCILGI